MQKLFGNFSFPGGMGSHATPEVPGSLHEVSTHCSNESTERTLVNKEAHAFPHPFVRSGRRTRLLDLTRLWDRIRSTRPDRPDHGR